jgi:hypothetical protein
MSWGIEVWSDEEEPWEPTERARHPPEREALVRCGELLEEMGLPHRPKGSTSRIRRCTRHSRRSSFKTAGNRTPE